MTYINEIPYLKVYKRQCYLPKDSKSTMKHNVVFFNNNGLHPLMALFKNHPMINPNNYGNYYMDPMYKDKIGSKNININFKADRKSVYKAITDEKVGITPYMTIEMLNGRNFIYDLSKHNSLYYEYQKKNLPIRIEIEQYIDYIMSKINVNELPEYKYKMILIDLDSWSSTTAPSRSPVTLITYGLYKYPELVSKIGNYDIYFYSTTGILRFNPSLIDKKTYPIFKREIAKITKSNIDAIESIDDSDTVESDDVEEPTPVNTGKVSETNPRQTDVANKFADPEEDTPLITDADIEEPEEINTDVDDEDPEPEETSDEEFGEIINAMSSITHARKVQRTPESIARDKELAKLQKTLTVDGKSVKELTTYKGEDFEIPTFDVGNKIKTTNDNVTTIKYANFDKSYNEQLMRKDTMSILTSLNDKSIPVYIKSIDVKDTSTKLTYKETYTVVLEDSNRVRHTLKFDMPKFIDNSFMYIEGNKKLIQKQLFMKPIVKTGPDEVQICSNYNKIFMHRVGKKMSGPIERFKKTLANDIKGVKVTYGDNLQSNSSFKTCLEYDELAKSIFSIKTKDFEIIFNQNNIKYRLGDNQIPTDKMCIGFYADGKPILLDFNTEKVEGKELVTFIIDSIGVDAQTIYDETGPGATKYMYTAAKIMNKWVPIVLLLGYCEGLTSVLRKAKIKYEFTDKRVKQTDKLGVVQFADGYLVFERYPFENSLLLNALSYIPTSAYNYSDFDEIDVYLELFDNMYNARNLANAFDTFYEFMIDPITRDVLKELGYPTDFVSVLLCANAMLADNSYIMENNMNLYRIRSNEIVNAILYKEIAMAYSRYRATSENNTPVKISIPQGAVISNLMKTNTVDNYSTLNPIFEATNTRIASPRGVSGMNLEQAYTIDKRAYSDTMPGLVGVSTAVDANVGINRHLTMEPNIVSARGFVDIETDKNKLTDANLFTPAEMLTPLGITRDDAPRVSMASKQSTHIVPIDKSSPVLISNGSEQTIQYYLSSDFIVRAEEDGEIVEIDNKSNLVIVKYKSGKVRAIDIHPRIVKNGASGFYVANQLKCDRKVGDKVKANDIIAYESKFFTEDSINGNRMNIGSLQKVAVMSAYSTFEDSAFVTKKISEDMATSVIMMKDAIIGKNADVDHIVKVGDVVKVGDPLVSFSTSYDDTRMNEFLRTISEEQGEDVKDLSRVQVKSKYGGTIEDIKIYCSVELSELSPSLRDIVSAYYAKINRKKTILNKYDKTDSIVKAGVLLDEAADKTETSFDGHIKGRYVDGVLIEFYVKYKDVIGVGDKIAFFSALKSVTGEVIEEGYEPYSEFRPDEEVSAFIGPSAILARQVPSTMITILGNKCLVELKRKLKEIYDK